MKKVADIDKGWKKLGAMLKKSPASDPHVKVGIMGAEATASYAHSELTNVEVASFNEYGLGNVPERSFIRDTFDAQRGDYQLIIRRLAARVIAGQMTRRYALQVVGQKVESDIKRRIEMGIPPPNAPETIKRKGSSKTLIDTGQMKNSITYAVVGV
jgi:hypothetical protein